MALVAQIVSSWNFCLQHDSFAGKLRQRNIISILIMILINLRCMADWLANLSSYNSIKSIVLCCSNTTGCSSQSSYPAALFLFKDRNKMREDTYDLVDMWEVFSRSGLENSPSLL